MNAFYRLALVAALGAPCLQAQAESLRCNGQFTQVGDSRLSVLFKCGEPVLKDSFCAPVFTLSGVPTAPSPVWLAVPGYAAPCVPVDEWLYDRGPGNMMATVRFQSGVVRSIRYGSERP